MNEDDYKKIVDKLNIKFKGLENLKFKNGKSIFDYLKRYFYNYLLWIDIADDAKPHFTHWSIDGKDFVLEKELFLSSSSVLNNSDSSNKFNLPVEIKKIIQELYDEDPLKCHYWHYSDDYLLPNSVIIDEFISNPGHNKALENIFALCERTNISKEFEDAMSEDGDYSNLLEQISKKVTLTFQKIWKDFRGTSIQLFPNGNEILIKVVDKAKYNFEDRSDGFKKFISILLMLSTQSRSNKYKNDIILIDEPDQSLYPTSAQHLRDELIEISKIAKIVYSTHSQYMIDSENINRHFIVEKKDDVSKITKEHINAPFSNDELLRRAIGSSIFEALQPINIIFEGYLDKQLFDKYLKFYNYEKEFSSFGKVFLSGISGVETLVQILILANKKFIIVADSDETSKNRKIEFSKNYPEFKDNWISYGNFDNSISTMEDFISTNFIESQINQEADNYKYDIKKNAIINIENAVNKDKELKQKIKNNLMLNLKKTHIEKIYIEFISSLSEKIKSL